VSTGVRKGVRKGVRESKAKSTILQQNEAVMGNKCKKNISGAKCIAGCRIRQQGKHLALKWGGGEGGVGRPHHAGWHTHKMKQPCPIS